MTTITALLTNKAYGYPTRGARRGRKPTILACLHQTSNATATAIQERNYANRAGSWGPSATAYIDRDGTIVRAIDPVKYAAWSQDDVASPNTKIPTAAEARAYLEELPRLWAKTSDAGRHAIAEAVFDRIDVLGVTDYTFTLSAHAKARGWDAAFGARDAPSRMVSLVGARGIAPLELSDLTASSWSTARRLASRRRTSAAHERRPQAPLPRRRGRRDRAPPSRPGQPPPDQ